MSGEPFSHHTSNGFLFVYVENSKPEDLLRVPGRLMVWDPAVERVFVSWLSNQTVAYAAEILGISRGVISHLRQQFGLTEPYTGDSRTTQWRRKNE